ncbi:hypothetical protein Celaphus_00000483 [Cervus elaphus hippelaphus]|uniref:Uncharacterized protein n=1 Tax=Cervus elaphus hippelaphus TaxID=46360 RepID=A0A212D733_CEREH|nr:hypothetical protein Celaphus_00000483 [Cervus elaphus hippelaphus]
MSAGQLEAHLFGGAVQGPSWSLTTDRCESRSRGGELKEKPRDREGDTEVTPGIRASSPGADLTHVS